MSKSTNKPILEFTGERFTPESLREIWYEHYHRYGFATPLASKLDVLDAACGEGYGSAMLATTAASVTAVDISAAAITHASARYADIDKLKFIQADCANLDLGDKKFDLIISFETLEHLQAQEQMLAGFKRLLKPTGCLLISSPDKAEYSDASGYANPWHVRELYRQELLDLLALEFPALRLLGQKLAFHSLIWDLEKGGDYSDQSLAGQQLNSATVLQLKPTYFMALCAASPEALPVVPALSLFADQQASVYQHYQHEIRKNMAAGDLLQQRDQKIAALEAQICKLEAGTDQSPGMFSRWFNKF